MALLGQPPGKGLASKFPMRRRSVPPKAEAPAGKDDAASSAESTSQRISRQRRSSAESQTERLDVSKQCVLAGLAVLRDKYEQTELSLRKSVEHPEPDAATLRDIHDLGVMLARRRIGNDLAEADEFFSRAFKGQEKLLGATHPATVRSEMNLEKLRSGVQDRESFRPSNTSQVWSSFDTTRDTGKSEMSASEFRMSFEREPGSPEMCEFRELQTTKRPPHHIPPMAEFAARLNLKTPVPPSDPRSKNEGFARNRRLFAGRSLAPPSSLPQPQEEDVGDDDCSAIASMSMPVPLPGLRRQEC